MILRCLREASPGRFLFFSKQYFISGFVAGNPRSSVFSNGVFSKAVTKRFGSVGVLLLAGLDTDVRQWQLAWPQVVQFVRRLPYQDHIANYLLDAVHGLQVLQGYADDPDKLIDKLQKLSNPPLSGLVASSDNGEYPRLFPLGIVVVDRQLRCY